VSRRAAQAQRSCAVGREIRAILHDGGSPLGRAAGIALELVSFCGGANYGKDQVRVAVYLDSPPLHDGSWRDLQAGGTPRRCEVAVRGAAVGGDVDRGDASAGPLDEGAAGVGVASAGVIGVFAVLVFGLGSAQAKAA